MAKRNPASSVMMQPGLTVNAATLATLLGVSINQITEWESQGMPFFAYGKTARRFSTTAVNEWIEQQSKKQSNPRSS